MSTATPKSQNLEACARFFRSSCDKRVPGDGGELVVSSFGASVTEKAKTPTKHTSTTRTKWQQLDTNMLYYVIWLYLYHAACHQTNTSSNPKVQAGGGGGACLLEQQVLKRSSQGIIRMCFQSEKKSNWNNWASTSRSIARNQKMLLYVLIDMICLGDTHIVGSRNYSAQHCFHYISNNLHLFFCNQHLF